MVQRLRPPSGERPEPTACLLVSAGLTVREADSPAAAWPSRPAPPACLPRAQGPESTLEVNGGYCIINTDLRVICRQPFVRLVKKPGVCTLKHHTSSVVVVRRSASRQLRAPLRGRPLWQATLHCHWPVTSSCACWRVQGKECKVKKQHGTLEEKELAHAGKSVDLGKVRRGPASLPAPTRALDELAEPAGPATSRVAPQTTPPSLPCRPGSDCSRAAAVAQQHRAGLGLSGKCCSASRGAWQSCRGR